MNFFRRWHAHHEFRHHFGHGHAGHHFGPAADGLAHRLVARVGRQLDLDGDQQRRLSAWADLLQQQRDMLTHAARGPSVAGLLAGEQFPREAAQQLLDARLDALRAAGPGLVQAFAEFFDALDAEQRQALRFLARRAGRRTGEVA